MKDYIWKPWKIAAVAVAALLLVGGGALALFGSSDPTPTVNRSATDSVGEAGTVPGAKGFAGSGGVSTSTIETTAESPSDEPGESLLSPALVRGGISFFAAFAVAFALRSFLKIFIIFAGIWAASLFFLSSIGWVEVHWTIIDDSFVGFTKTLGAQFESISSFITGSLPSAGLAGLGLVAGLKKG